MADIRSVTEGFSVAPQIALADIPALAAQGFKLVISNRPDGEMLGQPTAAQVESAVKAAGLTFVHVPFAGTPSAETIEAVGAAIRDNPGPVLAFCRSGTRSVTVWAISQVKSGAISADDAVSRAAGAGYDLSPLKGLLLNLAPG